MHLRVWILIRRRCIQGSTQRGRGCGTQGWRLSQDVGGPKEAGLARDGLDAASEEQRVTSCQSCGSAKQTHSSPSEASSRRSVQSWSPSFGKKEAVVSGFNGGEGSKRTGALRDSRFWRDV